MSSKRADRSAPFGDESQWPIDDGNTPGLQLRAHAGVNPTAVHPNMTRAHEMAHTVHGRTEAGKQDDYLQHHGTMEFQSEATGYFVVNHLGRATPESASELRAYMRGWLGRDVRPAEQTIRSAFTATDPVLRAGYPTSVSSH